MDGRARGQGILNNFGGYRCREGAASADGQRTCRSGVRKIRTFQSSPKQETRGDQMKITFGRTAVGVTVLESVPPGTPTDAGTSTAGGPSQESSASFRVALRSGS